MTFQYWFRMDYSNRSVRLLKAERAISPDPIWKKCEQIANGLIARPPHLSGIGVRRMKEDGELVKVTDSLCLS
jgi:hypothetical protein